MKLSFIIIAKNEDKTIQKTVKSIILALKKEYFRDTFSEIILVDSNSADSTVDMFVEIANKNVTTLINYSVVSYRSKLYSASKGRLLGFEHSIGEYIMFLDGDMIIMPSFIIHSLEKMKNEKTLSGTVGVGIDLLKTSSGFKSYSYQPKLVDAYSGITGGAFFARRSHMKSRYFYFNQRSREEVFFYYEMQTESKNFLFIDTRMLVHINLKHSLRSNYDKFLVYFKAGVDNYSSYRLFIQNHGLPVFFKYFGFTLFKEVFLPLSFSVMLVFPLLRVIGLFLLLNHIIKLRYNSLNFVFLIIGIMAIKPNLIDYIEVRTIDIPLS